MSVKRYEPDARRGFGQHEINAYMVASEEGEYVEHSAYAALEKERDELLAMLKDIVRTIPADFKGPEAKKHSTALNAADAALRARGLTLVMVGPGYEWTVIAKEPKP